ncbi:hypothetical protein ACN2C6_13605 [Caulobacter sp. ErkDOM-YI]|uniref:hypothetical protein n=1 Tax=unclassified Caulobacter TaxID=2648921 RepID=UPI003AF95D82
MHFDQLLVGLCSTPGAWKYDHSKEESCAFLDAMDELSTLENGASLLKGATLSFRDDILVDYLGVYEGHDGGIYQTFSFQLGHDLQVVSCEHYPFYYKMTYRGDRLAFERLAAQLHSFRGKCFAHLRDDQAAA